MPYLLIVAYLGVVLCAAVGCFHLVFKKEKHEPKLAGDLAKPKVSRRAIWLADCARRLREQM